MSMRALLLTLLSLLLAVPATAAPRIKDLASLQGVRNNQLVGYGIVVGLDGTGDQTTQTPFTVQSILNMLNQMGVQTPAASSLQLKNVAAVSLTTMLPAFARPGQTLDITVSSIGTAKSLRGGTLLMAPLKGADGQIYAMAQGSLMVGGAGASAGGSSAVVNHLLVGRIPGGATVERASPTPLGQGEFVNLELNETDFTTAARMAEAINVRWNGNVAEALDGRMIRVRAPQDSNRRVRFISELENLTVTPGEDIPRVIVNARTGSVVMNQAVTISACAVAHGSLSVTINSTPQVSQPGALSGGQTVVTPQTDIQIKADKGQVVRLPEAVSLNEVVRALNAVGATPQDLLAILQAMKAAGALNAELEVI